MVTQIDPISTPPTPADTPADFEQKASQVWADLYVAVPKMNLQAQEVEVLSQSAASSQAAAKTSETNAASSKNAAASSATAAKTSETNAASSKTAAANSATAAASSQTAAKTSETNAKSSETAAATAQAAAASSATAAASSQTAAASSATAAAASQTASKTSETNSASSKTAAANSASAAASSQTAAKTSETNAKASETASASSATAAASAATRAENAASANVNSVQRTAVDGAAVLPEGNDNRRPGVDATTGGMPASGLIARGNTQTPADYVAEYWDRAVGAWRTFASREWVNALINSVVGSVYVYPGGGTAAAPANVALHSRYVTANPFPGKAVHCQVQLLVGGVWGGGGGYIYSGGAGDNGFGILSRQYGDTIVTQTGNAALVAASHLDGNPFGLTANLTAPTPCRVLVTQARG